MTLTLHLQGLRSVVILIFSTKPLQIECYPCLCWLHLLGSNWNAKGPIVTLNLAVTSANLHFLNEQTGSSFSSVFWQSQMWDLHWPYVQYLLGELGEVSGPCCFQCKVRMWDDFCLWCAFICPSSPTSAMDGPKSLTDLNSPGEVPPPAHHGQFKHQWFVFSCLLVVTLPVT